MIRRTGRELADGRSKRGRLATKQENPRERQPDPWTETASSWSLALPWPSTANGLSGALVSILPHDAMSVHDKEPEASTNNRCGRRARNKEERRSRSPEPPAPRHR